MPQSAISLNLLLRLTVNPTCFSLNVSISDERRAYLLVAIAEKLFLERTECVKTCIECSLYLQFVIDEEINLLINTLLVNHPLSIVLIVRILKFRTAHRLSVDSHYCRVCLPICYCC